MGYLVTLRIPSVNLFVAQVTNHLRRYVGMLTTEDPIGLVCIIIGIAA